MGSVLLNPYQASCLNSTKGKISLKMSQSDISTEHSHENSNQDCNENMNESTQPVNNWYQQLHTLNQTLPNFQNFMNLIPPPTVQPFPTNFRNSSQQVKNRHF